MWLGAVRPRRHDRLEARALRAALTHRPFETERELSLGGAPVQAGQNLGQCRVGDRASSTDAVDFPRLLHGAQAFDKVLGRHELRRCEPLREVAMLRPRHAVGLEPDAAM